MNQQQKYIAGGVALLAIVIGTLIFRSNSSTSDLEFGQADTNTTNTATTRTLRTPTMAANITESQSQNADFLACTSEKFNTCTKTLTVTGSFQEQITAIASFAERGETEDNCIADYIVACSAEAIAKQTQKEPSLAICDNHTDPVAKNGCLNDMYPQVAIHQDNVSVCGNAMDPFVQKYCADTYNSDKAVKNKDVSWCSKLSSTERQNECAMTYPSKVALAYSDISYCKNAKDEGQVNGCFRAYVTQKMDPTSIETCKKTYDFSPYITDKGELDRMHRDCLNRLIGNTLESFRKQPDLMASGTDGYRKICALMPDIEGKACLQQLEDAKTAVKPVAAPASTEPADTTVPSAATGTVSSER